MKRIVCCITALVLIFALAACSATGTGEPSAPATAASMPTTVRSPIEGAAGEIPAAVATMQTAASETALSLTADELRTLIGQYESEKNYQAVYESALKLTELDPADTKAYIAAAQALSEMSKANYAEIDRLFALGFENAADARVLTDWAKQNQPDVSIAIPFVPDYTSAAEINTEGITTGNMTNAAKYRDNWWQGGLLTWQGDWVYLARPEEDFAIYKVRSDGSEFQRVGDAFGSSINVVGDWIYYLSINGSRPWKMRTDGSMNTLICDEECSFLSVSNDFLYYAGDRLYRMRTDGSDKVALTEDLTIFPCVAGDWVYYTVKREDGGLWRVSADGGEPRQVAPGFIMIYCVVDDWIYYVDLNNWHNLYRVHTDGTGNELILPFDFRITAINVSDSTLYMSFNVTDDKVDGVVVGAEIMALDLETMEKLWHINADTEPLCTGPDGKVYFFRFNEGMAWYSADKDGVEAKVE